MVNGFLRKYAFMLIAVLFLWAKTYIVYLTCFDLKIENGIQAVILFFNPLNFLLLIFGLSLFMKEGNRNIFIITVSSVLTFILISNITFYGFYNDFITIPVLFQSSNMGDLGSSVLELIRPFYLLLTVDIFILCWLARKIFLLHDEADIPVREKKIYFLIAGALLMLNLGIAELQRPNILARSFDREALVKNLGLYDFHVYDALMQTSTSAQKALADGNELADLKEFTEGKKQETVSDMFGAAKGRNVIFVSLESTQSFVVNEKVNGQEITPFLNDFINSSYYFENFYHQTEQGKTSDSEFIVANSLYPLGRGAVFFTHADNKYYTLQHILRENSYYTAVFHANNASFWNRDVMYESLGIEKFFDVNSYEVHEGNSVGWGLKDKEFFEQSASLMKEMPQPFYSYFITLTNHFPFQLEEEDKLLKDYDSSSDILNRYLQTVRYQDEALKHFIESLKKEGLYENSVIILMGDHYAISENHNKAMAEFLGKDEITPFDTVQLQRVPFLIHMPGISDQNPHTYDQVAGQIDVKPTLLQLLGIQAKHSVQFGSSVFSENKADFTVLRNGSFITEHYISASNICYKKETGEPLESSEMCSVFEEKAQEELLASDKIIYGDLLRFYPSDRYSQLLTE
ncbi:sulfatase-like hydrolase/transferase [Bacillus lacus]|uniref:Sulfatase-like hydrolase/transferase n=1 Tax=Metabacillus lacus TaxID=1983721 RepID=A0A7X2LY36_9BACI|nr:LTA synthase family protein [Metabacillus lacus]MRX71946.1 sulfatase-like hydrolase/transferase [Metabacillus lacus]